MEIIHEDLLDYPNEECFDYRKETPDFQKPLIYVTHPDDMETEIWVPPVHEDSADESDYDEDESDIEPPRFPVEPPREIEPKVEDRLVDTRSVASEHDEIVLHSTEVWFYRTGWQNRGVYAADDNRDTEMLYYADIPWRGWGSRLTIRKGGQTGAIIAESHRRGPGNPFEITFSNPAHRTRLDSKELGSTLTLRYGNVYSRTHKFRYAGRNLGWIRGAGVRRLRDLVTNEMLAEFTMGRFTLHRDGKLEIFGEWGADALWRDIVVVTALTCQQREREIRRAAANSVAVEDN